jgi:hypothetical protein
MAISGEEVRQVKVIVEKLETGRFNLVVQKTRKDEGPTRVILSVEQSDFKAQAEEAVRAVHRKEQQGPAAEAM